ncbi:MAG TPA: sugar ABC transporter permease [Pseudolysinimonas sp.]|jgi:raffinose/stachyose/melibiose transport system permease protein
MTEAASTAATTVTSRRSTTTRKSRRSGRLWLFILPAAIPYLFVVIVPSLQGIGFSFTNFDGLNPNWKITGLDNYAHFFRDPQALRAVLNTIGLAFVSAILENLIGLLLALALNGRLLSRNVLRVIFFTPVVIITVVVAFVWQFIYTPTGPLNQVLDAVGLHSLAQNWLGSPSTALWSIAVIVIWQFSGYAMVIYLAGLQGVPTELIEAASLDGAGRVKRFFFIIAPLLLPAFTVNLMLSLTRGFMIFDQIWVTTQGGPAQSTDSLSTLVYRNAFTYGEYGYSSAIAVILTIFVAVLGIVQYRYVLRGGTSR